MSYVMRMPKTYRMWQRTYVHMLSTTHLWNMSNKPLITQHIDRKMTSDVTVHTLKMGTLCQYYLIITILLKFFSPNEFWTVKIIQLPVTCYNNHTSNPKTDELAAFLSHVPPQLQLTPAWVLLHSYFITYHLQSLLFT